MHKQILKDISDEKLREFVDDAIMMIRETNHDLYETLENHLYKETYGCHFNSWMLEKALSKMMNKDGSMGGHWTVEQTNGVAKNLGIVFTDYNEYDWNYVMNMMYSDYYGSIPNDTTTYGKVARDFLDDKDAPKGKALKYYWAMND